MAESPVVLRQTEAAARAMSIIATHNGYGFASGLWGVLRVRCAKDTDRFSYFLNNVPVTLRRAASATA